MESTPFEQGPISTFRDLAQWSSEAPTVLANMLRRWELTPGDAFVGGASGIVLAVTCEDGTAAVLKIAFPHLEGIWEAVGLSAFPAGSAPEVLRQDPWTWSMLLSRVDPGLRLTDAEVTVEEALDIGGRLHERLSSASPPDNLPRLADAMRDYAAQAYARSNEQGAAFDALGVRSLVMASIDDLESLANTGPQSSLLHGDYNPGNILLGESGWQVVDPKPLIGDPSFDLWPLISQLGSVYRSQDPPARLTEQLHLAAQAAGCDPARVARWSRARTALNVSWYLAEGDATQAAAEARALRAWANVDVG